MIEIPITSKSIRCDEHNLVIPFVLFKDQNSKVWQVCPYCLVEFYMKADYHNYKDFQHRMTKIYEEFPINKNPEEYTTFKIGKDPE
jgi:hypothetical protein